MDFCSGKRLSTVINKTKQNIRVEGVTMPISQAKVKSVPSGDTLILSAVNNPSQERTLSLAFVSAPRLRREGDEVSATYPEKMVLGSSHVISVAICISVSGVPS